MRIAPVLPDSGALGAPAELRLPRSQLALEMAGGLLPAANPANPIDDSFFAYNTSAMTPLVPLWLAWMTDVERMANRSHGLDFQVGPGCCGLLRVLSICCSCAAVSAAEGWTTVLVVVVWLLLPQLCGTHPQGHVPFFSFPQTAWRLSSYVAVSYCNASSIAGWNCTRCDGIAAGMQPEEVGTTCCLTRCPRLHCGATAAG